MIETTNEQQIQFTNFIQEHELSYETDLRFSSFIPNVDLCDNGASFLTLEFEPDEVLDPLLTTLPLVAPSLTRTSRDNNAFVMTFSDPPFLLAQSIEFEVTETLGIIVSDDEDDTCCYLGDNFIEMHGRDETVTRRSYVDVVVTVSSGPDLINHAPSNPLDIPRVVPPCSPPSPSPECHSMLPIYYQDILEGNVVDCVESLGIFRGFVSFLNLHYLQKKRLA